MHTHTFYKIILCLITCLVVPAPVKSSNGSQITDCSTYPSKETVKIWVFFNSKKPVFKQVLSKKSLARRSAVHFAMDDDDTPVDRTYINKIKVLGGSLENVYRWGNAASFLVPVDRLPEITALPFVSFIAPVRIYYYKNKPSGVLKKNGYVDPVFPIRKNQLNALNVLQAHSYLSKKVRGGGPGDGVFIGFFDSGFRLDHACFNHLKKKSKIKAMHDFVDGDNDAQDSDSLTNHGTTVFAQVSGYDPGTFTGVAWDADIALARTEISEREIHAEEDNWVAALVWAESLGVDIVSSSLGYAVDFEDSVYIDNKYFKDYPFNSLDGHSTIVSHAADLAAKRGMIIVNAIGNEGNSISGTLNAPADVEGVISVGAIDNRGFLSQFSSVGPAADGRIKPDCVAPGEAIVVPGFKISNSYLTNYTGTSYSTPLVSGIVALIIQSMGRPYSSDNVIKRLYESCIFAKEQTEVDNKYGRGIPDALTAIMDSNELFIETTDIAGIPVAGVALYSVDRRLLGESDSSGVICAMIENTDFSGLHLISLWDTIPVSVGNLPYYKHYSLKNTAGLTVKVTDNNKSPVSQCNVTMRILAGTSVWKMKSSAGGEARLVYSKKTDVEISVNARGYFTPGTVRAYFSGEEDTVSITLIEIQENSFIVFPTVVKKDDRLVTMVFSCGSQSGASEMTASVYSVSGNLLWSERKQTQSQEPVVFKWSTGDTRRNIAPGMYYALLRHGKKTYKRKLLIAG
ncbi:MAG: S8 family serine peptidase [Chitinispirillaceae bacterium]|nr:S8 family serine peptidase [Chitinispirillaceae bacterium]